MSDLTIPNFIKDVGTIVYITSQGQEYKLETLEDTIPLMKSIYDADLKVAEFAQTVFRYIDFMKSYFMMDFDPMDSEEFLDLHSIELYKLRVELSKYYRWLIDYLLKVLALNSNIRISLKGKYFKLYKSGWVFADIEGV